MGSRPAGAAGCGSPHRLFAVLVLLGIAANVSTAAALVVRGDALWVENRSCPDGWEEPAHDTTDWTPVAFPWLYIWPRDWPPDPDARPFWGAERSHETCVRRDVIIDRIPDSGASAHVWADDDYDLFVNGVFVGASHDHAAEMPGESYDITPHLRPGRNVLAVRLLDVGGAMAALFSLRVPGAASEPTSWRSLAAGAAPWMRLVLLVLGLAVWIAVVRRLARKLAPGTRRLPTETVALRAAAAAVAGQLLFSFTSLYTGLREMPVLDWHIVPLLTVVIVLTALFVTGEGLAAVPNDGRRPRREAAWLAAIVVVALAFRTVLLDSIPVGFFQDEATNGNDALALAQVQGWLLWSESVGGRPTLFLYLLYAALSLFGVSYLTLKIVPVAVGAATVIAVWAFGRVAFGARVALWAAFLLAAMRWHVHFSRMAWEVICLPLFSVAGFALLLYGLKHQRLARTAIVASAAVLSLGLYTYAAYRAIPAVVAVFLVVTLLGSRRYAVIRRVPALIVAGFLAAIVAAPLAHFAWQHPDLYWWRYNEVSLSSYMTYFGTVWPWVDQIGRSLLSLNHVGDEMIRHNLPYAAHLDPITGTLFLLGTAIAVWRWHRLGERLVLVWFGVFLALAALTRDGPHATRLLGLAPACALLAGLAVDSIAAAIAPRLGTRKLRIAGVFLALAIAVANAHAYFIVEANHPWADAELNATGRSVCEYLRRQDGVVVYFSDDIGFWADGQCFFLARGRYEPPQPILPEQVLPGNELRHTERETVVVLGREFFDLHREQLQPDEDAPPRIDLPGDPRDVFDRQGELLYRLYHFGGAQDADG